MLQAVTQTEPEWSDDDRAWAIALLEVEADTCPGCGQPLSETTRPEAYDGYETPPPVRCQGCSSYHYRLAKHADDRPESLRFSVKRVWRSPKRAVPGGQGPGSPASS